MVPIEWLRALVEERDAYRRLLEEAGSLALAAHRLARARCMTSEVSTDVPTRLELRAAARDIAHRVPGTFLPTIATLARDCEALGLPVL